MHKSIGEKIRDFFIKLGKEHRIFWPIAVVGLAITIFCMNFIAYIKGGAKRFGCALVILCSFVIGSSFSFPIFNMEDGFVSGEPAVEEIAAADSYISLVNDDAPIEVEATEASVSDHEDISEADIVSLDDILENYSPSERISDENIDDVVYDENDMIFDAGDWRLILVNKQHPIPDDYSFTLGRLSGYMQCDERIIDDLLLMMQSATNDGVHLVICSPYRDLDKQVSLFERKIDAYIKKGYSYMDAYKLSSQAVTIPGASEHQLGMAIDLISDDYTLLDEGFENTAAGIWLREHCQEYGFILRYPKGKEYITSIEYEPWHFRYVGREAANIIMSEGICLEEFWDRFL